MVTTVLTGEDGTEHREVGTSGLTVTGRRHGDHLSIEVTEDFPTPQEEIGLMALLLKTIEARYGVLMVSSILEHYAKLTHKRMYQDQGGKHQIFTLPRSS